jgi:hypothetical protein
MLIRSAGPRDWRKHFFPDLAILLDGVEVKDVIEADDEAGYLIRYCKDQDGKPVVAANGLQYETERLEGAVEFTGTRRFSPEDAKTAAQAKRDRRAARNLRNTNRAEVRAGGVS